MLLGSNTRRTTPYLPTRITACAIIFCALHLTLTYAHASDSTSKDFAFEQWSSPLPSLQEIAPPLNKLALLGKNKIVVVHGNSSPERENQPDKLLYSLPDEDIRLTYAFTVINASEKRVRNVLMDFDQYQRTMPHITKSKLLAQQDNHWLGEYRLIFQMPMLTFEPDVKIQHTLLSNGDLIERRIAGDIDYSTARWQVISLSATRSLLVQTSWADIGSVSWLMRLVFSAQPDLHRLSPLTAAALTIQSIKERVENKPFSYRHTVTLSDTLSSARLPYLPTMSSQQQEVLSSLTHIGSVNIISPVRWFTQNRKTFSLQPILSAATIPQEFSTLKSKATNIRQYPERMDVISDITEVVDDTQQHQSQWELGFDFSVFRFAIDFGISGEWKNNQNSLTFISTSGDFDPLLGQIQWQPSPNGTLTTINLAHNIKDDTGFILRSIKNIPYSQLFAGLYVGTMLIEGQQQLTH